MNDNNIKKLVLLLSMVQLITVNRYFKVNNKTQVINRNLLDTRIEIDNNSEYILSLKK